MNKTSSSANFSVIGPQPIKLKRSTAKLSAFLRGGWVTVALAPVLLSVLAKPVQADPLDNWQRRGGLPGFSGGDVGYGLFVVCGDGVLTSPDAIRWSSQIMDSTFLRVAHGNGVFVMVGEKILTSGNAVDWVETATNAGVQCVTFANGTFVVADFDDGVVLTSPDGFHWTVRDVGTTSGLLSITYGGGLFVAVGYGGTIITSPDAITWTRRASGTSFDLKSVSYGNGRFVAVTWGCPSWPCSDIVVTSADGLTWTARTNPAGSWIGMNSVAFGNGLFAVGSDSQQIFTSPDGGTWTFRAYAPSWLVSMSYGDGSFLAVGGNSVVMTSSNGLNWTQRNVPSLTSVAWAADAYVAVGYNGTVLTSPEGKFWTLRTSGTPLNLYSVAYGNGTFAAVGQIILSSTNGINWGIRDSGANYDFETVAYLNGAFMTVGANGAMKVSTDGVTWSSRSSGTTATLYGLAYGSGTFVVVGAGGTIRTSADGVSWTPRTSGTAQDLNGVTYGNGLFVAQGNSGVILTSPDGVAWTPRNSGTGQGLATSAYGFGNFVVVGLAGTILTSSNGVSWVPRASGSLGELLLGVAPGPNTFVAVGQNGAILQSEELPIDLGIVQQPRSQTVVAGTTAQLRVGAAGVQPLYFEWHKDGLPLSSETNATLTLPIVSLAAAGTYFAVVSNAFGAVTSAPAVLMVVPLLITAQPQTLTVQPGSNITFGVSVWSAVPVSYQWHLNGVPLAEATSDTLAIANVQGAQQGTYTVVVSNGFGSVTSDPATLTVLIRPTIVQQPQSQTVAVGDTVTFSVTVTNEAGLPVTYRWRKAGVNVLTNTANQTTGFLTLTNVQTNQAGAYTVVVTNLAGSMPVSSNAFLTVVVPPTNQSVLAGSNVTYSVVAVGLARIRYQWQFTGTDLTNATNASLTLTNVHPADTGTYAVVVMVVTNVPIAPATFPATLTVFSADSDGDGLPDDWEVAYGLRPDDSSDAARDDDRDGLSNWQEYMAGTNPTNAQSVLAVKLEMGGPARDLLVLRFDAMSNKSYTVQCGELLDVGGWSNWWHLPAEPSNRVVWVTNAIPAGLDARYFRLVTPRRP